VSYCEESDVYAYGVPRGALPHEGRVAAAASASTDAIELDGHGFASGDELSLRAEAGGSLPSPLAEGTTYYALPVDGDHFQVAATSGGAAIDLTTVGGNIVVVVPLPIALAVAWASRLIDDMLPAHVVPLESPYPELVRMTCAELAAGKLAQLTGATSESLAATLDAAHKRLARWGRSVPIRGTNAPDPAGLATTAAATATATDARGWRRFGGL